MDIPTCIPVSGPLPAPVFIGLIIWETVVLLYGTFVSILILSSEEVIEATNHTKLLCRTLILYMYIACYQRVSKLLSNRLPTCMEETIPDHKQECKLDWPSVSHYNNHYITVIYTYSR